MYFVIMKRSSRIPPGRSRPCRRSIRQLHTNHRTRKAQAAGAVQIAKGDGETSLADIFTKLFAGPKLRDLSQRILW
jgi:hypothetical protein